MNSFPVDIIHTYKYIWKKIFYEDSFQSTKVKKHQLTSTHMFVIMKKFETECQNKLFFFAGIWDTEGYNISLKEREVGEEEQLYQLLSI